MDVLDALRPRVPQTRQFTGPQQAKVLGLHPDGRRLRVELDALPKAEHAVRWSAPDPHSHTVSGGSTGVNVTTIPPAGTRCLVLFAGTGIDKGWIVAFDRWPS